MKVKFRFNQAYSMRVHFYPNSQHIEQLINFKNKCLKIKKRHPTAKEYYNYLEEIQCKSWEATNHCFGEGASFDSESEFLID